MSTRIFKPISVAEIPKIRTSPLLEGRLSFRVQKVRRSLFHPNPEDTKRFLKEEFARLAAYESDKWDFDFVEGRPKQMMGRYEWTLITERPNNLNVMMAPIKQFLSVQDATEELYPPIQSSSESTIEDTEMMVTTTGPDVSSFTVAEIPKKQRLITDFMQVRKRLEDRSIKKLDGSTSLPQKKARMSLVDSAS